MNFTNQFIDLKNCKHWKIEASTWKTSGIIDYIWYPAILQFGKNLKNVFVEKEKKKQLLTCTMHPFFTYIYDILRFLFWTHFLVCCKVRQWSTLFKISSLSWKLGQRYIFCKQKWNIVI